VLSARRLIAPAFGVVLGVLLFACGSAFALNLHGYGSSFGSQGTAAGQFEEPVGVAVSEVGASAGEVYVADRANNRVEIFNSTGTTVLGEFDGAGAPTGTLEHPEWVAVDNSSNPLDPSAGDVYVSDAGHKVVDKFSSSGTYLGQITTALEALHELYGVAVERSGAVWIYEATGQIDKYSDALSNEYIERLESPFGTEPGFAIDGEKRLYVNRGSKQVAQIDTNGKGLIEELDNEESSAVSVDFSSGDVYVDNVGSVASFRIVPGSTTPMLVERFGEGHLSQGGGIAIDSASGLVYVADRSASMVRVFTPVVVPDVVTGSVSGVAGETVTVKGTVDPDSEVVSSCVFEYGTASSSENSVPCEQSPAEIGSGTSPVPVSVKLSGVAPATVYRYRLTAGNANGQNKGEDHVFHIPVAPLVAGETSSNVSSSVATLSTNINPGGALTTYRVEYGAGEQSFDTTEVSIGAGLEYVGVQVKLSGLQPGATYHYRFLAANSRGTSEGPELTFITAQSVAAVPGTLPDNRAYELVSSATENKNVFEPVAHEGQYRFGVTTPFRSSADGDGVTYPGEPPVEGGNGAFGNGQSNQLLARRGSTGWAEEDITPVGTNSRTEYEYFSSDLSLGIFKSRGSLPMASPTGPAGCEDLYDRLQVSESYRALFSAPVTSGPCLSPFIVGASADGRSEIFEAGGTLNEEGEAGNRGGAANLFDTVAGHVYRVNVLPNGQDQASPEATFGGPRLAGKDRPGFSGVISTDGSRVFWSSIEQTGGGRIEPEFTPTALYVRENPAAPQSPLGTNGECLVSSDGCTTQVDAGESACVAEGLCTSGGGQFWAASSDGSKAWFTSCKKLTADSTAVPSNDCGKKNAGDALSYQGEDLYEYDVDSGRLTDLTVDSNGDPFGADVQGVVATSRDGAYVYFIASGALASGAQTLTCKTANAELVEKREAGSLTDEEGERLHVEEKEEELGLLPARHGCNLYVLHDGITTYIASLLSFDNRLTPISGSNGYRGDWRVSPGERTAQVTPDGRHLVFISNRRLTGYENYVGGGPSPLLPEVFIYDAPTGQTSCVSCNPSGAPIEAYRGAEAYSLGGYLATSNEPGFMERWVSDDGSRVFFSTTQSLVPRDTNGLMDVYEWERNGSGSCPGIAAGVAQPGCIYLLSGGDSESETLFVDADATGANVFFVTREHLATRARNENMAVYDARVDGGFPETSLACTGTGCQGVPPAPPIFATPSSVTFSGVGNFTGSGSRPVVVAPKRKAQRCKHGFVRKRGRCVKRKKIHKAKKTVVGAKRRSIGSGTGGVR
jgi:hypothetical protein